MFKTNNLIPYSMIIIMGLLLYILWGERLDDKKTIERQENEIVAVEETMASIQVYNEQRFEELTKVRDRRWKRGKHKDSF